MNIAQLLGLNFASSAGNAQTNAEFVISLVRNGLVLLFAVIVVGAIIYAAISGFKYIRSQGDETKVSEATESIKYVLIGLLVSFIGVVAVIIISSVFSDGSQLTLGMRCALGDFHICRVEPIPSNGGCSSLNQVGPPPITYKQVTDPADGQNYCFDGTPTEWNSLTSP